MIRKPYFREPLKTVVEGESMTHQAHADSVDINKIVAQFDRSGYLPPAQREGQYLDVTGLQTDLTVAYAESNRVIETVNEYTENQRKAKAKAKSKKTDDPKPSPDADPAPEPEN